MSVNEIKVVVVGNSSVGKTCIVKKATTGVFLEDSVATLGVNYVSMKKNVSKTDFMLQIWDTAGQERYRGMAPLYYRGAHVAIICYSVIDRDSFEAVDFWKKNIIENVDGNVIIILIGNKIDLEGREVTKEEGENKAKELGTTFYEVSAKTGFGIDDLFSYVPVYYMEYKGANTTPQNQNLELGTENNESLKNNKCC